MNHQTVKIILIIIGALLSLGNMGNSAMQEKKEYNQMQYEQNPDALQDWSNMTPENAESMMQEYENPSTQ